MAINKRQLDAALDNAVNPLKRMEALIDELEDGRVKDDLESERHAALNAFSDAIRELLTIRAAAEKLFDTI